MGILLTINNKLDSTIAVLKGHVVVLAGFENLHPDELDLRLAILEHLLGGR